MAVPVGVGAAAAVAAERGELWAWRRHMLRGEEVGGKAGPYPPPWYRQREKWWVLAPNR